MISQHTIMYELHLLYHYWLGQWVPLETTSRLTCRSLGEIEAVGVVNLRTARPLTGHNLSSISTAKALIFPLLDYFLLGFTLHLRLLLHLTAFIIWWGVVLIDTELMSIYNHLSKQKICFRYKKRQYHCRVPFGVLYINNSFSMIT